MRSSDEFDTLIESAKIAGKHEFVERLRYSTVRHEYTVRTKEDEKFFNKPKGRYVTVNTTPAFCSSSTIRNYLTKLIAVEIENYIQLTNKVKPYILVVGMGNAFIVCDALGAQVVKSLLSTHNMPEFAKTDLGDLSALIPGVSGINGIPTFEIVYSIISKIKPDIVFVVDALTAKDPERLGCSFQFGESGIIAGGGIGSKNKVLSTKTLGVRTIAVGVPMMINAKSLFESVNDSNLSALLPNLILSPKEVDIYVEVSSKVLANAFNLAVHGKSYKDYLI